MVGETVELLTPRLKEAQIRAASKPHDGLPAVLADADKLKQVLLNLPTPSWEAGNGLGSP